MVLLTVELLLGHPYVSLGIGGGSGQTHGDQARPRVHGPFGQRVIAEDAVVALGREIAPVIFVVLVFRCLFRPIVNVGQHPQCFIRLAVERIPVAHFHQARGGGAVIRLHIIITSDLKFAVAKNFLYFAEILLRLG
jgi:hypothetical protein